MIDEMQRIELYKQLNPNELSHQQFLKLEHEIMEPKKNTISDEYFDFKMWCDGFVSRQERFGEFISKKLSKKENAKILEVGAGRTARLSRLLSEKGFKMTCIDPNVEIESNGNIEVIKEKFNYKNDITMYDYVIAQEPCDATEHVVRACVNQNIPFMMILCGVPHKLFSGEIPKDAYEWYDYLVSIADSKIKLRYVNLYPFSKFPMLKSYNF